MTHLQIYENFTEAQTFTWEELPLKAKNSAIDSHRDWLVDWDWSEMEIEDQTNKLEALGLEDVEIQFSGFYSQGDGASFTGRVEPPQIEKFLKEALEMEFPLEVCEALQITISRRSSRHFHPHTVNFECETLGEGRMELFPFGFEFPLVWEMDQVADKVQLAGEKWLIRTSNIIYDQLVKQYEYLTSDAEVEKYLADYDSHWTLEGKMI